MRILLTRPREKNEELARVLSALGHEVVIEPLLEIKPARHARILSLNPQAIVITSANGARALSNHADALRYRQVPVFAVGQATAAALCQFNVVYAGNTGVVALAHAIRAQLSPDKGPLVYVRGVHVAGNLAADLMQAGYDVEQVVLYEAVEKKTFSDSVIEEIRNNRIDGVVLFSPRTAAIFSRLAKKADITKELGGVTFYCLSQNVSDSILPDTVKVCPQMRIAAKPTLESLLDSLSADLAHR